MVQDNNMYSLMGNTANGENSYASVGKNSTALEDKLILFPWLHPLH